MEFTVNISMVEAVFILAGTGLVVLLIIWYANVNSDRKTFKEFIAKIDKKLDDIFDRLPNRLVESTSPQRLTDLGMKISQEIDAAHWASRNLGNAIQATKGKSPYGVQQYCFDLAKLENLSSEEKRKVENSAFDQGVTVSEILDVLAIELRDLLLTQNQVDGLP